MSTTLKDEVKLLIEPWRKSTKKPPFSDHELVVMALAVKKHGLTPTEVSDWVMEHFGYYTDGTRKTRTLYYVNKTGRCFRPLDAMNCVKQFETPVHGAQDVTKWDKGPTLTTPPNQAREFLSNRLYERKGVFPFMKLPPELRVRVYEMLLVFPGSVVSTHQSSSNWRTRPQNDDEETAQAEIRIPSLSGVDTLQCAPAKTYLALFQVSSQIFKEAAAVFYGANNFIFYTAGHLKIFLENTSQTRRKYMKHITFGLQKYDRHAAKAFKMLAHMSQLRELDIWADEHQWRGAKKRDRTTRRFPDLLKAPGIPTLRKLRGLDAVRFHGVCETFETLSVEMTQAAKSFKKRKTKVIKKKTGKRGGVQQKTSWANGNFLTL